MEHILKCQSCGVEVQSEQKYCSECGDKIVPIPVSTSNQCPNPECGEGIEGNEKFCPNCGTKIEGPEAAGVEKSSVEPTQLVFKVHKQVFDVADSYLKEKPDDDRAFDAMLLKEISRTAIAVSALGVGGKPDYSIKGWDSAISNPHILKLLNEERPKVVELPNMVVPMYAAHSLDTPEFMEIVSNRFPGRTLDIAKLERKRDRITALIMTGFENYVDTILNDSIGKYRSYLIDDKTQKEVNNISSGQFDAEANTYYSYYCEERLKEAQEGFERLTVLDPHYPYAHNMLYAIYDRQGDYEKAFAESVYTVFLDSQLANQIPSWERNIFYLSNMVNMIRQLGLTPFLQMMLENFSDQFGYILEKEGNDDEQMEYWRIGAYLNMSATVKNTVSNGQLISSMQSG